MLEKMQQSHFVKKYSVQFVNASGKQSAPFYFWDNKPHECSQTWQVVRSEFDQMLLENAREHGVDGARRRPRHGRRSSRATAPSASRAQGPRGPRQGRRRRQRPERAHRQPPAAARLGSDPQQGRDLDLLGRRLPRHRPGRGRDDGAPDARQAGLVLVHPAARQHRQRRRRRRRSTTCSRTAARTSRRSSTRKSSATPAVKKRIDGRRRASPATSRRRTIRIARPRRRATAGCWSATRGASSIRCIRPACCSR